MGEHLPAARGVVRHAAPGVDRHDDALRAEAARRLADQLGVGHGRRVDGDLVGACAQQHAHVVDVAHPPAHRKRHEAAFGRARDHVEQDRPRLVRGGDVEEAELVGSLGVVAPRHLDRIARIREVDEAHALDDAAVAHVEAGNDAAGEHQPPAAASASASRTAPV